MFRNEEDLVDTIDKVFSEELELFVLEWEPTYPKSDELLIEGIMPIWAAVCDIGFIIPARDYDQYVAESDEESDDYIIEAVRESNEVDELNSLSPDFIKDLFYDYDILIRAIEIQDYSVVVMSNDRITVSRSFQFGGGYYI